jgi:hypothetical protein
MNAPAGWQRSPARSRAPHPHDHDAIITVIVIMITSTTAPAPCGVYAESLSSGVRRYLGWVQQPDPSTNEYPASTTAHIYRECRPDDRAFIDFVAPGIRWMDLKVPRSATLTEIKSFVEAAHRSGRI